MRVGFGYDSHVFGRGGTLKLCGCTIPGCDALKAHSDGDVALHAAIDALFGAAGLGDIGAHFPDSSPEWKGADSAKLAKAAAAEVRAAGFVPWNIDLTLVCERPRIAPHVADMKAKLAEILGLPVSHVSVKGKTNEGMDAIGEGRGIAAYAAVLLEETPAAAGTADAREAEAR